MKKNYLFILLFLIVNQLYAQDAKQIILGVQKAFNKFNETDTTYVVKNKYKFTTKIEHSQWREQYKLTIPSEDNVFDFSPSTCYKLGFSAGWRWISFSMSFNIKHNDDTKNKKEYNLNLYTAPVCVDLYYQDYYTGMEGVSNDNTTAMVLLTSRSRGIDANYIFNHKKFSYSAAYTQSTKQIKSAGSFILGLSYLHQNIDIAANYISTDKNGVIKNDDGYYKLKYSNFSINMGYSYNYVFLKHFLANISLTPSVSFKNTNLYDGGSIKNNVDKKNNGKRFGVDFVGRASFVYNTMKFFAGISYVYRMRNFNADEYKLKNNLSTFKLYVGIRFLRRK